MRSWWKSLSIVAGGLVSLGGFLSSAGAQFPPPGGYGMPPGGGMMGPTPGMMMSGGPPPGAFSGNPNLVGQPADFPNPAVRSGEPTSPFSLKDEGIPGAFTDQIDPRSQQPLCLQIEAGYTMLWFGAGKYPTLVTTGSAAAPFAGAFNQPGTGPLSGSREPGLSSAFHTNLTYWVLDPERLSLEGNFFIMEQRSIIQDFTSSMNGEPVLARPYLNAVTRQEDSDLRALPGLIRGSTHDSIRTRLMGAETNLKLHSGHNYKGASINFLSGLRWLRLDERYNSFDMTSDIGGFGFNSTFSDTFTTYNQFFGGQVGLDWQYRTDRLTLGLSGKVAVGRNYQTIKISGETVISDINTQATVSGPQGLFAQPTNVGVYRASQTSVIPEFGAKVDINLTERVRFNIGYTFLFMTNAVRPGDQIERSINIQPLNITTPNEPLVPGAPIFRQSTLYTHMLNFGIEFLY